MCPPDVRASTCSDSAHISFPHATTDGGVAPYTITYTNFTNDHGFVTFNTSNPNEVSATFPRGTWTVRVHARGSLRDPAELTDDCTFTVIVEGTDITLNFL